MSVLKGAEMAELDTMTLPVLPLTNDVVLPGMVVTLALETDEAKAAADAAAKAGNTLLLVPRLPDGRYARVGSGAPTGGSPRGGRRLLTDSSSPPWSSRCRTRS